MKRTSLTLLTLILVGLPTMLLAQQRRGHVRIFKDHECVRTCAQDAGNCLSDVRDASRTCFEGCAALVETARTTCADDRTSDACATARAAAAACLRECHGEARPDVRECIGDGRSCVRDCPDTADRDCVAECRSEYRDCRSEIRDGAVECREGCADLHAAAREACADDRTSEACEAAREALRACVAPCRSGAREALMSCHEDLRSCLPLCVDAEPTDDSSPGGQ